MVDNMNVVFYEGSNTIPNCAENVNWYLFTDPIEVAGKVVKSFHEMYN